MLLISEEHDPLVPLVATTGKSHSPGELPPIMLGHVEDVSYGHRGTRSHHADVGLASPMKPRRELAYYPPLPLSCSLCFGISSQRVGGGSPIRTTRASSLASHTDARLQPSAWTYRKFANLHLSRVWTIEPALRSRTAVSDVNRATGTRL